jgi:hypothetical protein
MASTSSRRHESRLWLDQRFTNSSCDDTTAGKFSHSRFAKEISYSGWSKALRACTSCLLPVRDRSLSAGCWAMGAYYLIDAQEPRKNKADNSDKETERPWNVSLLRPFFC